MNFKKIGIILFLVFSLLPIKQSFAQTTNVGFVPVNIWYSKDPFEEGDKIKIYTLIFNPDTKQLSGTVTFFDGTKILGTKDFSVSGGSAKDISISWVVSVGDHTIFAQIQNAKFLLPNGKYQDVSLTNNKTENNLRTVSKKIVFTPNNSNSIDKTYNDTVKSIENIGNNVISNIPPSVSEPIATTTNVIDKIRENANISVQKAKEDTKNKIDAFENMNNSSKNSQNTNSIQKPFEYVALFILSILGTILKYKILFYGILAIITLSLIRYLWHLFF